MQFGEYRLHHFLMPRFGGADEIVVGQLQFGGKRLPDGRQIIAIRLRAFPFGHRRLLDFLAMFVQAGQEERLLAQAAMRPCNHISNNLLVGVAEVRLPVDVVNGGRDVKAFAHVPLL